MLVNPNWSIFASSQRTRNMQLAGLFFLPLLSLLYESVVVAEPVAQFESTVVEVLYGDNAEVPFVFNLTNSGDSNLEITKIDASCGCTEVISSSMNLLPGASAAIEGKVKTSGRSSSFRVVLLLSTNESPMNQHQLIVVANPAEEKEIVGNLKPRFDLYSSDREVKLYGRRVLGEWAGGFLPVADDVQITSVHPQHFQAHRHLPDQFEGVFRDRGSARIFVSGAIGAGVYREEVQGEVGVVFSMKTQEGVQRRRMTLPFKIEQQERVKLRPDVLRPSPFDQNDQDDQDYRLRIHASTMFTEAFSVKTARSQCFPVELEAVSDDGDGIFIFLTFDRSSLRAVKDDVDCSVELLFNVDGDHLEIQIPVRPFGSPGAWPLN